MKFFKSLFLSLMITATVVSSKPSEAAVGAIVAAPGVVTAGLVVGGLGGLSMIVGLNKTNSRVMFDGIAEVFLGLIGAGAGLIILDGEQGMNYTEISKQDALKLNLTELERASFNAELDQVNALASYVDSEVSQMDKASVQDAALVWESVSDSVSPGTFSAMKKVTAQLFN